MTFNAGDGTYQPADDTEYCYYDGCTAPYETGKPHEHSSDVEICYFCGEPIDNWHDPFLPASCWRGECRSREAAEQAEWYRRNEDL